MRRKGCELSCSNAGRRARSAGRYAVSLIPFKGDFPLLTLLTNLLGALLISFIVGAAEAKAIPQTAVLFLKTCLCGFGKADE